ncbi:MAG: prepilin-type N-terminal cleavage/methylation domain-containing protein [Desulfobaccales bacterium]
MTERRTRASAGFTLLELMISLALVSLLSLVALTALNLSLKAVSRGHAAADNLQELRVGQSFLERSLSSAVGGVKGARNYFLGDSQEIRFLTFLPLEAFNLGGVYHWRIMVGRDDAGQGAVAVEQCKSINWLRDPRGVEIRQIVLTNVTSVRFFYGQDGKEFDSWDGDRQKGLPQWVRMQLALGNQPPRDWIIPIHVKVNLGDTS